MKYILAIILFSIIILFHELGHFLLAKRAGVRVNEFCLGLGPTLVGFTKGETKYSIKLLPFGGACMMEGEDDESADERAFNQKSVWNRISIVVAGPVFNFIMAFIFALIVLGSAGYDTPEISDVMKGYPAEQAGMQAGDTITDINGKKIHVYREVSMYTIFHEGEELEITYVRDGVENTVVVTPQYEEETGRYYIGFYGNTLRQKGNILTTIKYSIYEVKYWIWTTLGSLKMLLSRQVSVNDMSGPVGIVKSIGDTYDQSLTSGYYYVFLNMLNYAILLSANLGVMNLLPLPALDGGRLVFLLVEAVRGKKIDPEKEGMVHFAGIMLLMALMVVIMFNDIRKLMI